jgi:outer membrane protein TolC
VKTGIFWAMIFFAAFFQVRRISAEEGTGGLSLERARELALAHSKSLAKYTMAVQNSLLDEKTQRYAGLPSPSMSLSASVNLWDETGLTETVIRDSFGARAGISISQSIWDGGKNALLKSINAIATEMSRQDALGEYYGVLDSADTAFYGVLEAMAGLEAAEKALETAVLSLSMAEIRFQSRMISDAEYLQALAEKETRENSRNQARRDLLLCRSRLKSVTALDFLPDPEGVDFDEWEGFIGLLGSMNDQDLDAVTALFRERVKIKNPSIARAVLNSRRAEQAVTLEKKNYVPSFGASLSTGLNYSISRGLSSSQGALSLSGSIPLDYWVTSANVEKKKIASGQAALDYQIAGDSLDLELQTALMDLLYQAGSILSSRRAAEYAQRHFDYVMELYRLSRNSQSELSDAAALLETNRNNLIRAQYGFLRALSKIRSLGVFETEGEIAAMVEGAVESGNGRGDG